jgi:hypothetical protein
VIIACPPVRERRWRCRYAAPFRRFGRLISIQGQIAIVLGLFRCPGRSLPLDWSGQRKLRRCIRSDVQVWRGRGLRACSVSPYRCLKVPTSRAPVAECLRPRDDPAHPHSNAAEHGSLDRPQAACAVTAVALSIRPAADIRSANAPSHGELFQTRIPGCGGASSFSTSSWDSCQSVT